MYDMNSNSLHDLGRKWKCRTYSVGTSEYIYCRCIYVVLVLRTYILTSNNPCFTPFISYVCTYRFLTYLLTYVEPGLIAMDMSLLLRYVWTLLIARQTFIHMHKSIS